MEPVNYICRNLNLPKKSIFDNHPLVIIFDKFQVLKKILSYAKVSSIITIANDLIR